MHVLPNPFRAHASLLCHSFTHQPCAGISTCCSSTTPFGLALVPGLPREDEPSPGNLGLTLNQILTDFSLLTPAFSLPCAPPLLTVWLQRSMERSPTTHTFQYESKDSVLRLAPVNFRRRDTRLVSCYALFQGSTLSLAV